MADSVDAITDMVPCLPSAIEEMIDGMADVMVAFMAVLNGMFCTLLITGCASMY